jgi:hypothetical protein
MFFRKSARDPAPRPPHSRRLRLPQARPNLEALETRVVPYATTGNAWPSPQLVTISFVPDGTVMAIGNNGNITSNLFSYFAWQLGATSAAQWEDIILKAAQQWAQQTNINLTVVNDDGEYIGAGPYQQGNPNFGDIRVGGFNFGALNLSLAEADYPPPANNYSLAGDIAYNTGQTFNIGTTFDLFTTSMHEMGHALGLGHSGSISAVMYPTYEGALLGLSGDDVSGIRAIYGGARSPDRYDAAASNGSFAAASDITSAINTASLTALVTGLDVTTTGDLDYYKFTAPANSAGTMTVTVQSSGLSLLTPRVSVYNASQVAIGSACVAPYRQGSSPLEDGATLSVTVSGVTPGATYYVKVQGVDNTSFSTGAYALTLNLGTGPNPTVPLPNTQLANGDPLQSGGGTPQMPGPNDTPQTDVGPDPGPAAPAPAAGHAVDANLVNGLVSHSAAATVVAPTPAAQSAAPLTTSQVAPPVAVPARGQVEAGLSARANGTTGEAIEQLSRPAQADDSDPAPATQAVPESASPPVGEPATNDAWLAANPEAPVEQASSAPAVAEATAGDWTPDGALAAASALFGGAWLRWHAAHQQDERRRHQSEVNEKRGAS